MNHLSWVVYNKQWRQKFEIRYFQRFLIEFYLESRESLSWLEIKIRFVLMNVKLKLISHFEIRVLLLAEKILDFSDFSWFTDSWDTGKEGRILILSRIKSKIKAPILVEVKVGGSWNQVFDQIPEKMLTYASPNLIWSFVKYHLFKDVVVFGFILSSCG